jgi:ABC-type Fe3+/spermidine/putrescine transport system ATPase subunit
MTVAQNVAYPLDVRKVRQDERERRVADALRLVGLEALADKLAIQLSGGQQQRTALARAIVFRPRLLLFDEPLSNLDLKLREQMRIELKRIQRQVGITSIYVTHDQAEALALSDEVAIMSKGRIVQMGPPAEIYGRPANSEVSRFMGVANVLPGRLVRITGPGRGEIEIGEGGTRACVPCRLGVGVEAGAAAVLSVRPEHVAVSAVPGGERCLEGEVFQTSFLGSSIDCRVRCGTLEWRILAHPRERLRPGQRVYLRVSAEHSLAVRGEG